MKTYEAAKVVSIQVPKSPKCRKLCPNRKFCLTTTTTKYWFSTKKTFTAVVIENVQMITGDKMALKT